MIQKDEVKKIFTMNTTIANKTENIKDIFCDEDKYQEFKNFDKNTIVIGPRGYGKTAYFKLLESECEENFEFWNILTLYIKVDVIYQQLAPFNKERVRIYPSSNLLKSYLILKILSSFLETIEEKNIKNIKTKFNLKINHKERKEIKKIISKLNDIKKKILRNQVKIIENQKNKKSIGIEVGDIPKLPNIKLSYDAESNEETTFFEIDETDVNIINFRDFLSQLIDLLNLKLIIFFDEFSEIDEENQKEIFQFIKHLTEGTGILAKIAIIPPRYYYYTGENNGPIFDPKNRDATEIYLIDRWDQRHNNKIHLEILQKRIDYLNLNLKVEDIFDSKDLPSLCWEITMSNPRDYLDLLNKAYLSSKKRTGNYKIITIKSVKSAVNNLTNSMFESLQITNKNMIEFMAIIIEKLKKKNNNKDFDNITLRFVSEKRFEKDPNFLRDYIFHKIVYSIKYRKGNKEIDSGWEYVLNFMYSLRSGVFGSQYQSISAEQLQKVKLKSENRIYVSKPDFKSNQSEKRIKNCPNCNNEMPNNAKFCSNCGHPFELSYQDEDPQKHETRTMDLEEYQNLIKGWGDGLTSKLYELEIYTITDFIQHDIEFYEKKDLISQFRQLRRIYEQANKLIENLV